LRGPLGIFGRQFAQFRLRSNVAQGVGVPQALMGLNSEIHHLAVYT
jgi:hypothetical protein